MTCNELSLEDPKENLKQNEKVPIFVTIIVNFGADLN